MAVLDQRVFNLIFISLLLTSCSTITVNTPEYTEKYIEIQRVFNNKENEISKIKKQQDKYKREIVTTGSIATTALIDNDLWIGKLGGELIRYNIYTKDQTKFLNNFYSIKDYSIKKIIKYKNSIIALQSDRINIINLKNNEVRIELLPEEIARTTDLIITESDLYISTLGYGLWRYNINNGLYSRISESIDYISSLLEINGTLFIGTMKDGLYSLDLKNGKLESRLHYPLAVLKKNILKMNYLKNKLYLGTSSNGLIVWDLETNKTERYFTKETISDIFVDKNMIAASFIGFGLFLKSSNYEIIEDIRTNLLTNNITTVNIFNNMLLIGNIKKGLTIQEIIY